MRKNEKIKSKKKDKKTGEKKRVGKKGKRGPKGVPPEMGTKIEVFTSELSREIVTKLRPRKKTDFEHPTKKKKMKENERK